MAKRRLTPSKLEELRLRMIKHCYHVGHPHPEDLAGEYVIRLLEGLHARATVGQAYIDIIRLQSGRKSTMKEDAYKSRQALTMVASSKAQEAYATNQPCVEDLTLDQRIDLKTVLSGITHERTRLIMQLYLEGWTGKEMAEHLQLTESRVNQIVNRTIEDLSELFFV